MSRPKLQTQKFLIHSVDLLLRLCVIAFFPVQSFILLSFALKLLLIAKKTYVRTDVQHKTIIPCYPEQNDSIEGTE